MNFQHISTYIGFFNVFNGLVDRRLTDSGFSAPQNKITHVAKPCIKLSSAPTWYHCFVGNPYQECGLCNYTPSNIWGKLYSRDWKIITTLQKQVTCFWLFLFIFSFNITCCNSTQKLHPPPESNPLNPLNFQPTAGCPHWVFRLNRSALATVPATVPTPWVRRHHLGTRGRPRDVAPSVIFFDTPLKFNMVHLKIGPKKGTCRLSKWSISGFWVVSVSTSLLKHEWTTGSYHSFRPGMAWILGYHFTRESGHIPMYIYPETWKKIHKQYIH